MRLYAIFALVGILFFSYGVSTTFANTTNRSFDPSYALQPFAFSCNPYKLPFQTGLHYVPQSGPCTFSIPSGITGIKTIAVYKGTPGNATFVAGGPLAGSPTLAQEDNVNFGIPLQDQDYFSVVYGYGLATEAALYDTAFRTGSSTNTLPPGGNYALVTWKWGGKPASEYEPVIIIPGILGSWQKNGVWVLDPITHIYDNLINTFLANGYIDGKTLFEFPYDWEEPNEVTASLLANKIQEVKQICGCTHVNLIGHSMGGLVASQYIESDQYQNDVDQLFLVATPLEGSPKAYKAWEGGEVDFGGNVQNAFMNFKFSLAARENGYANVFDYIRGKPIESIQQLLPIYSYLFDPDFNILPYPDKSPINGFLETLVNNFTTKVTNRVRLTTILADTQKNNTLSGFQVKPSTMLPEWQDGEPTQELLDTGDETVPRTSIEDVIGTADKEFDGTDHLGVASTSTSYIFKQLNNEDPSTIIGKIYPTNVPLLLISPLSPVDIQVTAPDSKRLGKDFTNNTELNEIPNAFYSGFNTEDEYAVILNPQPGAYSVKTIGTGNGGKYTLVADYFSGTTTTEAEIVGSTTLMQIIGHTVLLSSTAAVSINIDVPPPPTDTQAPIITITSPQASKQYTHADTIKITATISDKSPIATTTYTFNGKLVSSSTPISLATVPLGTSTLTILAKDSFGNVGSSSVSFQIVATPESCKADIALAYKNKWISKKAIYDSLLADCDKLNPLFANRDTWNKIPALKRDKKTQQSLTSALNSIKSLCDDLDKWIKDKSNSKDALQLLNQNLQWFRNHDL